MGHRLLARSLCGAGRPADAVEHLHRVLTSQRSNAAAWFALGRVYLAMGDQPPSSPLYAASALLRAHSWALGSRRSALGWTVAAHDQLRRDIESVLVTVPLVSTESSWGTEGLQRVQAALFALDADGCSGSCEALLRSPASAAGMTRALAAYETPSMSVTMDDLLWGPDFERFWFVYCPRLPVDELGEGEEGEDGHGAAEER